MQYRSFGRNGLARLRGRLRDVEDGRLVGRGYRPHVSRALDGATMVRTSSFYGRAAFLSAAAVRARKPTG